MMYTAQYLYTTAILYTDDDCYIPLRRDPGSSEHQHEYINASYIDVGVFLEC